MTKMHLTKHKLIQKIVAAHGDASMLKKRLEDSAVKISTVAIVSPVDSDSYVKKLSKHQWRRARRYGKVPNLGNKQFTKEEVQNLIQVIEAAHGNASVLKKRLEDSTVKTREEIQKLIQEIEAAAVVKRLRKNQPEEDHSLDELEHKRRHWPELPGSIETSKRR